MNIPSPYRTSVDIDRKSAWEIFDKLPGVCFSQPKSFYANRKMKNAPSWQQACKLIQVADLILNATNGVGVHQKSMLAEMLAWNADKEIGLSYDSCDHIVYGVRCFVAQLCNHKSKDREMPVTWQSKFGGLWAKVAVNKKSNVEPKLVDTGRLPLGNGDDDVQILENVKSEPPEIVDLAESSESELDVADFKRKLFETSDPELAQILALEIAGEALEPKPKRRRITGKTKDKEIKVENGKLSVEAMKALATGGAPTKCSPKAWSVVRKNSKGKRRKKPPMKVAPRPRKQKHVNNFGRSGQKILASLFKRNAFILLQDEVEGVDR